MCVVLEGLSGFRGALRAQGLGFRGEGVVAEAVSLGPPIHHALWVEGGGGGVVCSVPKRNVA